MRMYQASDYGQIFSWCRERELKPIPAWALPPTGFIVDNTAVGFLVMTDNDCGILDFFISNPQASKLDRGRAIDKILKELIAAAKSCSIKVLFCDSKHKSIQKLVLRHDFKSSGQTESFIKELI